MYVYIMYTIVHIVNRKSRYWVNDQVSMYDVAVASLLAPMIHPPMYNLGVYEKWLDLLYDQDKSFRNEVEFWRGTMLGQYCMALYQEHRRIG